MAGLKAGRLRHRVSLQERQTTQDSDGSPIHDWIEIARPWAAVEPLSAREFIAAQSEQSQVTTRIVMRYRSGLNGQMRIVFRDKIFNIAGIQTDMDSGLEYVTLPCTEGVNEG